MLYSLRHCSLPHVAINKDSCIVLLYNSTDQVINVVMLVVMYYISVNSCIMVIRIYCDCIQTCRDVTYYYYDSLIVYIL